MASTIKVYATPHPTGGSGAVATSSAGPDSGALSLSNLVNTAGWTPGTYAISITSTLSGMSESLASVPISLVVNAAAGISDDFNRADGALGANWATIANFTLPTVLGNKASGPNDAIQRLARWAGAALGADQTVIAKARGTGTQKASVCARLAGESSYVYAETDGGGWVMRGLNNGNPTTQGGLATSDPWIKIVVVASTATWYSAPDNAGSPGAWTQRHTVTDAVNIPATGQPGFFFWTGADGGSAVWVDDFSAS